MLSRSLVLNLLEHEQEPELNDHSELHSEIRALKGRDAVLGDLMAKTLTLTEEERYDSE